MGEAGTDNSWKRMSFKGNKVWAALGADGNLAERNGKTRIKYNRSQSHEYQVPTAALKPEDQAVPAGSRKKPPAEPKPAKRSLVPRTGVPSGSGPVVTIYTDGASSGNPGPAGIGVVLTFGDHRKEISEPLGIATNNQAELTAILRALTELKRRDLPAILHTDSSYRLGLLTQGWKPRANQELVARIRDLIGEFREIEFVKVKGHAGVPENERADALATRAADMSRQG